jgi:hypothetical protein
MEQLTTIAQVIERLTAGAILTADSVNLNAEARDNNRNHTNYGRLSEQLGTLKALGISVDHGVWEDNGYLKVSYLTIGDYEYIKRCVNNIDVSSLPVLCLENAKVGEYYKWCDGWQKITKIYQISDEYMRENELCYKNRATAITSFGYEQDFALVPLK